MQPTTPDRARYSRASRWFHWLAFAFVTLAYLLVNLRELYPRGSGLRQLFMQGHIMIGLLVFVLVLPRLLHRLRNSPPAITPPLASWQPALSAVTHVLLYAFLVVQPVLGLLTVFTEGRPVVIPFTGLEIPSPWLEDSVLSHQLEDVHKLIGEVFYYVIGAHILAALWHHFGRGDDTLKRML